jgi:outer membrane protein OmpA-like peptidoglycan-associated protein
MSKFVITLLAAVALSAGCTPKVPTELANARVAYSQAMTGPAKVYAPADLHTAEVALADAEQAFLEKPYSYRTKDLAYVAERIAQRADAIGHLAAEVERTARAGEEFTTLQTELLREATAEAQELPPALQPSGAPRTPDTERPDTEQPDTEQARRELDPGLRDALTGLDAKQESRGTVITLSGPVGFEAGQATLLPEAKARIDQVLDALKDEQRSVLIEGHADSQGSESRNLGISTRRAEAVRAYMIERGYPSGLIRAIGIGELRPVGDNTTEEGRASNRRVEIIVQTPAA